MIILHANDVVGLLTWDILSKSEIANVKTIRTTEDRNILEPPAANTATGDCYVLIINLDLAEARVRERREREKDRGTGACEKKWK